MKKRLTKNQREYRKQISRLKQRIRYYENKGFISNVDIRALTSKKRITKKDIEKVSSLRGNKLYEHIFDVGEYGDLTPYKRRRSNKKESSNDVVYIADVYLQNFKISMQQFNYRAQEVIFDWLDNLLSKYGKEAVASMLQKATEADKLPGYKAMYSAKEMAVALSTMLSFMENSGPVDSEVLIEQFESMEEW